jgi:hypothetical protein
MSLPELDNLVRAGHLQSEPGDQGEFDGLVRTGRAMLKDASNPSLAPESAFDLAYGAAHALALAALRWHGYRTEKRYAVFQALEHTVGIGESDWRILEKCHRKRNKTDYEGRFEVDAQLLKDLLAAAKAVEAAVGKLGPVPGSK